MFRILVVLGALAAWNPAYAQEPAFPAEIQAALDHAAAAGVPVVPLEKKAAEGVAKDVPAARIALALAQLEQDLLAAEAVRSTDDTDLQCAIAAALRAGVTAEGARTTLDATPADVQTAAMWTLADLMGAGLREGSAVRLVRSAVAAGKPEYGLRGLATAAVALLASGATEQSTVARVTDAIDHGRSPLTAVPSQGPPPHSNGNGNGNGSGNANANANGHSSSQRSPRNGV